VTLLGPVEWLFVGLAALSVVAERIAPRVPGRVLGTRPGASLLYFLTKTAAFYLGAIGIRSLFRGAPPAHGLASWGASFALQSTVVVVLVDLKQYALHVVQHRVPLYWRFHRLHHAPRALGWAMYSWGHPLDFLLVQIPTSTAIVWCVGARPETLLVVWSAANLALSAFVGHVNVDYPRGRLPWLARVVMTPNVHAEHHALDPDRNTNYGEIFAIWDVLFRTFRAPAGTRLFGTSDPIPTGFLGQLASPLRGEPSIEPGSESRSSNA
jgi:sterol desaturase/sphingolipid hydroxylase (fatty acid hydroxylase superfamily)